VEEEAEAGGEKRGESRLAAREACRVCGGVRTVLEEVRKEVDTALMRGSGLVLMLVLSVAGAVASVLGESRLCALW
jgi:hypothetical protein